MLLSKKWHHLHFIHFKYQILISHSNFIIIIKTIFQSFIGHDILFHIIKTEKVLCEQIKNILIKLEVSYLLDSLDKNRVPRYFGHTTISFGMLFFSCMQMVSVKNVVLCVNIFSLQKYIWVFKQACKSKRPVIFWLFSATYLLSNSFLSCFSFPPSTFLSNSKNVVDCLIFFILDEHF